MLPAVTIPGEEPSPYLYSKAQRLSGSSSNQEGKMDLFPLHVVASSLAGTILVPSRRPSFLSVINSAGASGKTTLELLEPDNMKRQRKKVILS